MNDFNPFCTGNHFGGELCDLLDLPQETKTISIHFHPDNVVCIDATIYATVDKVERLVALMKRYKMESHPHMQEE
jgi:hypothetical protein